MLGAHCQADLKGVFSAAAMRGPHLGPCNLGHVPVNSWLASVLSILWKSALAYYSCSTS